MNKDIEKYNAVITFKIKSNDVFCVEIKSWLLGDKWMWNVYANIYEKHNLFNKPEEAFECLPFNGGCTFDRLITHEDSKANSYNRSPKQITLKLGSDYMHIHDDYDNHPSPFDFIPVNIINDANDLVKALLK